MIRNYLTVALRNLWRNKTFSFINIAGLSVGLACCMLILLYTKDEVSFDRFHQNIQSIYRVVVDVKGPDGSIKNQMGVTGALGAPAFKKGTPEIEDFVRIQGSGGVVLRKGNEVFEQDITYTDASFLNMFSFPIKSGDPKSALNDPHSIVITEDMEKKYFGNASAMGKTLELKLDGEFQLFKVSAVTKKPPQNSSIQFQMLLPWKYFESKDRHWNWFWFSLQTFIKLRPGSDPVKVGNTLQKIALTESGALDKKLKLENDFTENYEYKVQPMTDLHLSKTYQAVDGLSNASDPIYSYILTAIAIFILLIACINFVNMSVARSLKRAKEIGIRKVVGGQRGQLIFQFLGESFLLCFLAFTIAIGIAIATLPMFNELANKSLSFVYLLDWKLAACYIALFAVTVLLAGFYPALVLSGFNPVTTLYGRLKLSRKNYLSKGLVTLQFALATFFIIVTITMVRQFNLLTHADLGYNDKNLVVVHTGDMDNQKIQMVKDQLAATPGVTDIAARFNDFWSTSCKIKGKEIIIDMEIVDPHYTPLLQVPVIAGNAFPISSSPDSMNILVNESFLRESGMSAPLGQHIDFNGSERDNKHYTIIGVVRDYHYQALTEPVKPQVFTINTSLSPYGQFWIKLADGDRSQTIAALETKMKKINPFRPFRYNFVQEENIARYDNEAHWKQIISFAAMLTIFISCTGLFGLATLAAEKRTKEIGIRKVLGASVMSVISTLSTDFVKLVFGAGLIAVPVSILALNKWLSNYPFRVHLGVLGFVIAIAGVVIVALITTLLQSIRAAVANPISSLRTE